MTIRTALLAIFPVSLIMACLCVAGSARAEMSAEDLAKLAQNPVGNLISVPFQNNTNFNYGVDQGGQHYTACSFSNNCLAAKVRWEFWILNPGPSSARVLT